MTQRRISAGWLANPMRIVWCISLVYALGFLWFFPKALTNFDEVSYVRQAAAFAAGTSTVDTVDPYTGLHTKVTPSDYPAGTAALIDRKSVV